VLRLASFATDWRAVLDRHYGRHSDIESNVRPRKCSRMPRLRVFSPQNKVDETGICGHPNRRSQFPFHVALHSAAFASSALASG
jgi:hypothetical protein